MIGTLYIWIGSVLQQSTVLIGYDCWEYFKPTTRGIFISDITKYPLLQSICDTDGGPGEELVSFWARRKKSGLKMCWIDFPTAETCLWSTHSKIIIITRNIRFELL